MIENELASVVLDTCFHIHKTTGPGLLESVYEEILSYELAKKGFKVERQKLIPISWDNLILPKAFFADLIINDLLILELKSVEKFRMYITNNCLPI